MSSVFVIQNQQGQFLSRQQEWVENTEISALYKTPHRDLAINELFEVTSKHSDMRAKVVEAETSDKGLPLVANLPALEFPKVELPEDMNYAEDGEQNTASEQPPEVSEQPVEQGPIEQAAPAEPDPHGVENPRALDSTVQVEA